MLRTLGFLPGISGSEVGGYQTQGDIVQATADGIDLNALWSEFQQVLDIYNEKRAALVALMTFPVNQLIETVPQGGEASFEMASEFGEPKALRADINYFQLAYDFHDYDLATRYTWKYLRDADARQVEALHQQALGADNRLIFKKVMEALFVDDNRDADINTQNYTVFSLYNGKDGAVPPKYKDITFDNTHSHYMTSGNVVVDSDDLEDLYENVAHHGYGIEQGTTFILLCNRDEIKEIRKWRAGQENGNDGSNNPTATATFDFIPAEGQPATIVPNEQGLLGSRPGSSWNGLPVIGSYAGILIVEEAYIPSGYMVLLGSGGEGDLQNPVGLREHANPAYRGLRLLPGNQQRYPLIDSYYARAFGTGIRQRGGAAIMMIGGNGTSSTYDPPTQYANNGVLVA
ncbi:MAG: hypothetical protein IPK85_02595 [Gemmatimonadetes bacterium]|nr:hypothetical protein [Gemmatimonadota bacterium]